MYNRYIPQPDGTYRRNRIPDPAAHPRGHTPPPKPAPPPQSPPPQHQPPRRESKDTSIASLLKKILPREFDTGDLMIVVLLLLICGDCPEEQNNALLTLLLYFFM
jgi:hypothetical protein